MLCRNLALRKLLPVLSALEARRSGLRRVFSKTSTNIILIPPEHPTPAPVLSGELRCLPKGKDNVALGTVQAVLISGQVQSTSQSPAPEPCSGGKCEILQ